MQVFRPRRRIDSEVVSLNQPSAIFFCRVFVFVTANFSRDSRAILRLGVRFCQAMFFSLEFSGD